MRCKACDKLLDESEIKRYNKETLLFEDLCRECLNAVWETLDELEETIPSQPLYGDDDG